jgi:hypothetical protein
VKPKVHSYVDWYTSFLIEKYSLGRGPLSFSNVVLFVYNGNPFLTSAESNNVPSPSLSLTILITATVLSPSLLLFLLSA